MIKKTKIYHYDTFYLRHPAPTVSELESCSPFDEILKTQNSAPDSFSSCLLSSQTLLYILKSVLKEAQVRGEWKYKTEWAVTNTTPLKSAAPNVH